MVKVIAVIVIIIMFVRIDLILQYYDQYTGQAEEVPADIKNEDIKSARETIPVAEDRNLKQSSKTRFLALLEDFHTSPSAAIRSRALEILKDNPIMFGPNLDTQLESHIFRWRDLMINNDPELINFLLDLWNVLPGQNQEIIRRFFSLWMDINMEHFIAAYSRSKDVNCSIAGNFGDTIPEEEKLNEYYDREDALKAFITKGGINLVQKALAEKCLMVLNLEMQKMTPKDVPQAPVPEVAAPVAPEAGGVAP